jgi:hypothetical protein
MKYVGCLVPNEVVSKYVIHALVPLLMTTSKIFSLGGSMMVMPPQASMFLAHVSLLSVLTSIQ